MRAKHIIADFQSVRVLEEKVCFYLFLQNPVFTSLPLSAEKGPFRVKKSRPLEKQIADYLFSQHAKNNITNFQNVSLRSNFDKFCVTQGKYTLCQMAYVPNQHYYSLTAIFKPIFQISRIFLVSGKLRYVNKKNPLVLFRNLISCSRENPGILKMGTNVQVSAERDK